MLYEVITGEIVNGIVQAINAGGVTLGLDRKAEGSMPRNHQIRGERFRLHDRVRALLLDRITSYNVCYTKLLRDQSIWPLPQ